MAQSQTTFGKVTNTKHPLLLDTTCVFFQQRFLSFICLFHYHLSHRPSQPLMLRRFGGRVSRLQKWMTIIVGTQRYNVYIYYMIITYIIIYIQCRNCVDCGPYTPSSNTSTGAFSQHLCFLTARTKKTHFGSLASFCRASASSI